MSSCSGCRKSVHLFSDSDDLKKEKLFSQTVCIFCWTPLASIDDGITEVFPMIAGCGHMFHLVCYNRREESYKDTPTRCPIDGAIVENIKTLHFLDKSGSFDACGSVKSSVKEGKMEELARLVNEAKQILDSYS